MATRTIITKGHLNLPVLPEYQPNPSIATMLNGIERRVKKAKSEVLAPYFFSRFSSIRIKTMVTEENKVI